MKLAAKMAAPKHVAARPRAIASAIRSSRLDDDCRIVCPRFAALAQEDQVDDGTAKREGDGPNGWVDPARSLSIVDIDRLSDRSTSMTQFWFLRGIHSLKFDEEISPWGEPAGAPRPAG